MTDLSAIKCQACRPDAPKATDEEIKNYMLLIPQWTLIVDGGVKKIVRQVKTKDFVQTMKLVNAIADLAEEEGHHPMMLVEYSALKVWWWSHEIKGLHQNDFVMAAKTDKIFKELPE